MRNKKLFLTFDDGPESSTESVLALLEKLKVPASFFVITEKAERSPKILQKILSQGHSVGDHSLDHRYRAFFSSDQALESWILNSHHRLAALTGQKPIGFRPPAGVVTPPLKRVLAKNGIPLILWQRRFFDTVFPWTISAARLSLGRTYDADIVLLHDRVSSRRLPQFLKTLGFYIQEARKHGFEFSAL